MTNCVIVGAGIHPFGRFKDKSFEQIGYEALEMALKDANMGYRDIQAAFVARVHLHATTGVRTLIPFGRTTIPVVDVEAACAAGAACLRLAVNAIESGQYDIVLALGVEKMPRGFMAPISFPDWQCHAGLTQNPMWWALNARRHMHEYGTTIEQIAKVAYKNHRNSVHNLNSMYQKEFSMEQIMNSPLVSDPIRLYMICAPNEGAAAIILASEKAAKRFTTKPVKVAACSHRVSNYPLYNPNSLSSYDTGHPAVTTIAAKEAYETAGIGPEDIDCVELQDTDAFCEIEHMEQLMLCKPGEGGRLVDEGITEIGGRLPVSMSGGLISKGEPIGASGLGQVHELVMQLRGEAGKRQVDGAQVGLAQVFGAHGHAAVTILKV